MTYLNVDLKIIHRDLRAANVFLSDEESLNLTVKIGDFGHALQSVTNLNSKVFNLVEMSLPWQVI